MATKDVRVSSRVSLQPWEQHKLMRELAIGERTSADLGREYGMAASGIRAFKARNLAQIEAIAADLGNELAGLWIADKGQRLAAYQADYEMTLESDKATHHEWVKARTGILHNVAEETGQLPARTTVAVTSVTHVLVGIDPEELR